MRDVPLDLDAIQARRDALMAFGDKPHLPSSYGLVKFDVPALVAALRELRDAVDDLHIIRGDPESGPGALMCTCGYRPSDDDAAIGHLHGELYEVRALILRLTGDKA